jgi:ABC-2 type transport system permease protein
VNMTIARITARALIGRRRFLLLFPFPLLVVGLTALAHALKPERPDVWGPGIIDGLGFAVMLPVVALIVGTGVLGAEIEDGTVVHILAKPLTRREIVLAKLVVAVAVTGLATAVPMFVAGTVALSVRFGLALALGCLVGALGYSTVFLVLSLLTRRPVLLGLLYVLLWESLLGNLLASTRQLSIHQYAVTLADKVAPSELLSTHVGLTLSIVMSVAIVVVGTLLSIDRLRSFTLSGETS